MTFPALLLLAAGLPAVSVSDVFVLEGDEGQARVAVAVTLSAPAPRVVTVDWATAEGAAGPEDFVRGLGTLVLQPGQTRAQVHVRIRGDRSDEPCEALRLLMRNAVGADIADGAGVVLIVDDDDAPPPAVAVHLGDVDIDEPDGAGTRLTFTATLAEPAAAALALAWRAEGVTATEGEDFPAATGTVTIPRGGSEARIEVPVNGDLFDEDDEELRLVLALADRPDEVVAEALGRLRDNDPAPELSISDVEVVEGDAGDVFAEFPLFLTQVTSRPVTVRYAAADGNARAGRDYEAADGELEIPPLSQGGTLRVAIVGDLEEEGPETFVVNLSDADGAVIGDAQAVALVADDDGVPEVRIEPTSAPENEGPLAFRVVLSAPARRAVSVSWATQDGTATAGADYAAGSGSIAFDVGDREAVLRIPLLDDQSPERDEDMTVVLGTPSGAVSNQNAAVGTIADDDRGPSIFVSGHGVEEPARPLTIAFGVTLEPAATGPVSVQYATADDTATAGSDYQAASGTLTFGPGQTQAEIEVVIVGDDAAEGPERFLLRLHSPQGATLAVTEAPGFIDDDDAEPELYVGAPGTPVVEPDDGTVDAVFTLSLSRPVDQPVTVEWETRPGTAVAGADFVPVQAVATIPAGQISLPISVAVVGDTQAEPQEMFDVVLVHATGATVPEAKATATIDDDDR